MRKRSLLLAVLFTAVLFVSGALIEDSVDTTTKAWRCFETAMNFPGSIVLSIVGPGHGIRQLVLPFVFSLIFYTAVFWLIITFVEQRLSRKRNRLKADAK